MTAQINLYDKRFLKRRDWLSLDNVAGAAAVLYLSLGLAAVWATTQAGARARQAEAAKAELQVTKQAFEAATKALAERKPSPELAAQVAAAEQVLRRRDEIAALLEGGSFGSTRGFAEYLRGFARQAPSGLWLTGFEVASGGDLEIRGRALVPATVPEYIRRLGTEEVFRGRNFAALSMERADAKEAAGKPAPIDFVLSPRAGESRADKAEARAVPAGSKS